MSSETETPTLTAAQQEAQDRIETIYNLFSMPLLKSKDIELQELFDELSAVGVRDGVLYKFANLSQEDRNEYFFNATAVSHQLDGYYAIDSSPEQFIPSATLIAALGYVHAGALIKEGYENKAFIEELLNVVDGLASEISQTNNVPSLIQLIQRARGFNVPDYIFYDSVMAVPYDEILDSIKPKENTNDSSIIGE
jgi:hypothetical protein